MSREQALFESLDALGIIWSVRDHAAVFTVEDSKTLHDEIAGEHSKNLFLKDASGQFWLVTAPHDARVDLKALPSIIGSKKLSFGKAEDMERLLDVTPGSVTPLAVFNDQQGAVKVVIDARLAHAGCVNVHPLRNTATLGLTGRGLVTFLAHHGHSPLVAELPAPQ